MPRAAPIIINALTFSNGRDFQRHMAERFGVGLALAAEDYVPLTAEIEGYVGERLRFASLHFDAHRTLPASVPIKTRRLVVAVHQQGTSTVAQDGRTCPIGPGQMFLLDPARPFAIKTTAMRTHALFVDAGLLRQALPQVDILTAQAMETNRGAGAVLRTFVDELVKRRETLSEPEANALAFALPHLIAASMQNQASLARSRPHLRGIQRERVTAFVQLNLDQDLDATRIAVATGLSTRTLYALFDDEPESVMQMVWRLRLERARAELADASAAHRSIADIGYAAGFKQQSHFSRAFRASFGLSPRAFRQVRRSDAAPLDPHR